MRTKYSYLEEATWADQLAESKAYLADASIETKLIHRLAEIRGLTTEAFASKVVEKQDEWKSKVYDLAVEEQNIIAKCKACSNVQDVNVFLEDYFGQEMTLEQCLAYGRCSKNESGFVERTQPVPEVSNSEEFYTVNSVIKDLEGVDPWNLDDFDKDLINWTDSQFFDFSLNNQNRYFVINSQVTPYRQLRQAMMEIQSRLNGLQKTTISYKRCLNDIERVKHEMEQETDPFEKKTKDLNSIYCTVTNKFGCIRFAKVSTRFLD